MTSAFPKGTFVVLYIREPREKIWGVLHDLNPAGVAIRGIELRSFDDWLRDRMQENPEGITPSLTFYPLARVEKILADEDSDGVPSLAEQVRARTGREAAELLENAVGPVASRPGQSASAV